MPVLCFAQTGDPSPLAHPVQLCTCRSQDPSWRWSSSHGACQRQQSHRTIPSSWAKDSSGFVPTPMTLLCPSTQRLISEFTSRLRTAGKAERGGGDPWAGSGRFCSILPGQGPFSQPPSYQPPHGAPCLTALSSPQLERQPGHAGGADIRRSV